MSYPERDLSAHCHALLADSKRLVTISRLTRKSARVARQHAANLLGRCSTTVAACENAERVATLTPAAGGDLGVDRRGYDRLPRPGRRQTDRRPRAADSRRVLLAGPDEGWRLLLAYLFEEAGYVVYEAGDASMAATSASRLLPDVVVVQMELPGTFDLLARLSGATGTFDIPVVVLTSATHSAEAIRARAAGAVTLPPHEEDAEALVGEVDTLIAVGPRTRRSLKRRLLDLQELARLYTPDADGQARLRRLIDHLQVAIFAITADGHCIAASQGATSLTGYSHLELVTSSVLETVFPDGQLSAAVGLDRQPDPQSTRTTTMVDHAGNHVAVYAAAVEEIMPGVHVAALAAADPRIAACGGSDRPSRTRRAV